MRKLATAALALSVGVMACHWLLPQSLYACVLGGLLLLGLVCFAVKGKLGLRLRLICFGAAVGVLACAVTWNMKAVPSMELDGRAMTVEARVLELPYVDGDYSGTTVLLTGEDLPRVKMKVSCYDGSLETVKPGNIIKITGKLSYSGERYGEIWDRLLSDGIFLRCYLSGEIEVLGHWWASFLYFPQYIRQDICATSLKVFGENAPFMTALLTGDKDLLYDDVKLYADMSRSGILHVVAVSGMHVSFLVGFLRLIIRKKKTAAVVGISALWVFAAVAGWTPSVIRAAFMHTTFLAAPLVDRESDGITSLTAALALLLLANPYSIASVSLQLSFSAMAGILLVTPRVYRWLIKLFGPKRKGKSIRGAGGALKRTVEALAASVSASVGAAAFSTPLTVLHFGAFATYAILANLLVFWAVSAAFLLGYAAVFAGMIFAPLGRLLGICCGVPAKFISAVAGFTGSLPYSKLWASDGYFLFWLIFTYVLFAVWTFLRRKKSFRPVLPLCLSLSVLLLGVIDLELTSRKAPATFTAVDVGQGQSLVFSEKGKAIVIDCGGQSDPMDPGEVLGNLLNSRGIKKIEVLCITHTDQDHINGAARLMYLVDTEKLLLPPISEGDASCEELLNAAEETGTEVYIINQDAQLQMDSIVLDVYRPLSRVEPLLVYRAGTEDKAVFITGDADLEYEYRLLLTGQMKETDIFMAGHHGSKDSSGEELLSALKPETVVISCGWNSYGHPAPEALDRFERAGVQVLRTDLDGIIDLYLEG